MEFRVGQKVQSVIDGHKVEGWVTEVRVLDSPAFMRVRLVGRTGTQIEAVQHWEPVGDVMDVLDAAVARVLP